VVYVDEHSQFSIFSEEAIQEIAQLIFGMIAQEVFVTVMYEEIEVESDMESFGPDTYGARSLDVVRNEQRIDDVCEIMEEKPPWHYDIEEYPVMFFSIESWRNYYGYIAITVSKRIDNVSDGDIARAVVSYIREHLPEPFIEDEKEPIDVHYIYGTVVNQGFCYVYNPDGV
jgi:hypothetical protein